MPTESAGLQPVQTLTVSVLAQIHPVCIFIFSGQARKLGSQVRCRKESQNIVQDWGRRDAIKFNWFLSDQIEPRQPHFAKIYSDQMMMQHSKYKIPDRLLCRKCWKIPNIMETKDRSFIKIRFWIVAGIQGSLGSAMLLCRERYLLLVGEAGIWHYDGRLLRSQLRYC